ncbi:hypothetical protein DPMN_104912 [Dreissena polymorpha]|uniref:Uncharacterized protein n=1 Tax=Dreissena polymorpha TaxID=45954 RepID=A0A9D4HBC4_DREPO|nr:hypothetical protein DPMN_104912 [Dreissena polymorpha]
MPLDADLEGDLKASVYFQQCVEAFQSRPAEYIPKIRGLLILMMAFHKGSRAEEFVQLRVCILPLHNFNPFIHSLITICAYKCWLCIELQFRHVRQAQQQRGVLHFTVTIDEHKTVKWGRYAYFHLNKEEMTLLDRFCQVAALVYFPQLKEEHLADWCLGAESPTPTSARITSTSG